MKSSELIEKLQLLDHPEGGYFRQTYKSDMVVVTEKKDVTRAALTHIYYLLTKGTYSRFHKNEHDEIWNFYDGDGVCLYLFDADLDQVDEQTLSASGLPYHTVIPEVNGRPPNPWVTMLC